MDKLGESAHRYDAIVARENRNRGRDSHFEREEKRLGLSRDNERRRGNLIHSEESDVPNDMTAAFRKAMAQRKSAKKQ